ncbi:alkali metal cation h+ antiporter nha1 [Trichoderma cornu-damae]|uniref:Alkali metal cation h+ antiporter nha1 n=1 Tax=Trichoderma cornu-damae TaxID=654480 RepID=A0A9P8QFK2_9HYPO|nr:alkali metal cation h+ antiporter nha1 [Trichoderma cornu-damae]
MAWDNLDITKPHLVYIILGGFTSLFMLCSSIIKERMYIGEATVATLCGVIFGPHAANLIDPRSWGSVDIVTVEFSRIVLVVQCFAVGVELPKFYMEKHWRSVVFLLVPVMAFGWLIVSLFVWWMIPPLSWLESLVVAACVTATDPVLASSVVGKGKFAKRVPKHLRDLLSAESGCNDGMAFPFIYLSLYLIQYKLDAGKVTFHFIVYVILYECIFGAVYGFMIGYIARRGIRYAEEHDMIDRESFLVFYFALSLFCAGSGSILGVDDLLVGFAAGVGFSNDGWFGEKTEESHVSNVIDLLLNLAYFVYFGTIIPWEQYNNGFLGMEVWRLVVIAVFVILFRRIPVMMLLKPFIPDIKNWREALFAGHFGPIGVGAIFVAILARAELEHDEPVPLSDLPPPGTDHFTLIYLVWPIVTFLVISSILVHGSSVAVFTLGKRINTLTLTMSYTAAPEDGPSWMNRLPRISSQSRSQARTMSEASFDDYKMPEFPPGTIPPTQFLRRQREREEDNNGRSGSRPSSLVARKRKHRKWDDGIGPGGPISQSAIFPNRSTPASPPPEKETPPLLPEARDSTFSGDSPTEVDLEKPDDADEVRGRRRPGEESPPGPRVNVYEEGDQLVFEDEAGEVLDARPAQRAAGEGSEAGAEAASLAPARQRSKSEAERFHWTMSDIRRKVTDVYSSEMEKRKEKDKSHRRHEPARAYQFGNTIIVEDEDGEVVKTYELPSQKPAGQESTRINSSLKYFGLGALARHPEKSAESAAEEGNAGASSAAGAAAEPAAVAAAASSAKPVFKPGWTTGFGVLGGGEGRKKGVAYQDESDDDRQIRFTIGGVGRRMTKEDFIREVQKLDAGTRKEVVDQSTASSALKDLARQDPPHRRASRTSNIPEIVEDESSTVPSSASASTSVSPAPRDSTRNSESVSPGRQADPPQSRGRGDVADSSSHPSELQGETAVERKRRLAALGGQQSETEGSGSGTDRRRRRDNKNKNHNNNNTGETPAERRRREAALGMGSAAAADDSDSDDEGTPRVPPARKGIRFAEQPNRQK